MTAEQKEVLKGERGWKSMDEKIDYLKNKLKEMEEQKRNGVTHHIWALGVKEPLDNLIRKQKELIEFFESYN